MGNFSFKLPDLGEGIVESEVAAWYIKPGDQVQEDQHIADVMTDKAQVELTSPVSGTVLALACEAGEMLGVGRELVRFEIEGGGSMTAEETEPEPEPEPEPETARQKPSFPAAKTVPAPRNLTAPGGGPVLASPSVRQRARDEDIDLSLVPGSGPAGRISHKDLDAFITAGGELALRGSRRVARQGKTEIRITGLRRVIARKMQQAKRQIPHYSYVEEVDMTALEALRRHLNANRDDTQEPPRPKLTLLPFLIQALVKILPHFPHCNARYDDEAELLTQYDGVHMGIATMTPGGLMVPVIRHCESLGLWQVAAEVARLSQAARDGSIRPEELGGSTITLTSLGALGGIVSTPVINAPETAIIGVNRLQQRPVVQDGAIAVRRMMNLSSSFDHRIVDGYDGARLIQALKDILEHPGAIFVEDA